MTDKKDTPATDEAPARGSRSSQAAPDTQTSPRQPQEVIMLTPAEAGARQQLQTHEVLRTRRWDQTVPGGYYIGTDGKPHDAHGRLIDKVSDKELVKHQRPLGLTQEEINDHRLRAAEVDTPVLRADEPEDLTDHTPARLGARTIYSADDENLRQSPNPDGLDDDELSERTLAIEDEE